MVRWSPSKIQCAGLVREMRYFMSDVPSLRSFIPTYPFLWWGLSESSKWLCGCLAGLSSLSLGINLVFIGVNLWNIRHHLFRRVFWKAACNLSVSLRLQSLHCNCWRGHVRCWVSLPLWAFVQLQTNSKVSNSSSQGIYYMGSNLANTLASCWSPADGIIFSKSFLEDSRGTEALTHKADGRSLSSAGWFTQLSPGWAARGLLRAGTHGWHQCSHISVRTPLLCIALLSAGLVVAVSEGILSANISRR